MDLGGDNSRRCGTKGGRCVVRTRFKAPVSTAIAIGVGLVVLLGYFIDFSLLVNLRTIFLQWAVVLAAVALLVGVANLITVHWRKVTAKKKGGVYSIILIVSLIGTLVVVGYFGPTGFWSLWIFNYIQVPIESSLMALLTVVLAYASTRLLKRRVDLFSLIFVATILIILLGSAPLLGIEVPGLHGPGGLRSMIAQVPAVGGARGILLGVALGTIATGLRVLMGADRPFWG